MKNQFHLYLERVDAAKNMRRFYLLAVEDTLFGEVVVTRRWGRIGGRGRSLTAPCRTETEALTLLLHLALGKVRRNYRPCGLPGEGRGDRIDTQRRLRENPGSAGGSETISDRMKNEAPAARALGGIERSIGLFDQPLGGRA